MVGSVAAFSAWSGSGFNSCHFSNGYHAATNFVSSTASWAWNYGTRLWNQGISALRSFGQMLYNGATRLYNKAKTAVGNTYRNIKEGVTNLRTNATNWAKEQARAAAQRIYEAKKAVTNAAKAAVRQAIKFTKLPVVAALTKPLLAGVKLVSGGIKVMASVVAVTQQAIRDPDKFRQKLFLEAAQRLAPLVEGANEMWDKATQFVEDHAAEIAGIAVGAVVGIGCGAAIGWTGVGAVACGALAGAVGSAVTGYMNGKRGWDLAGETALGGLFGAAGGAAGTVGGAALGAGLRALGGGMRAAGGKAVSAGLGEARTIGRGLMSRSGGCLGPGNSFTGDTKVLMADGSHKPIRDVKLGDKVLATDPTTGRTAPRVVTALIVGSGTKQLVDITVTMGGPQGSRAETITATAGHPFWVADQQQWREAKDLKPGYTFETADHGPAAVAGTRLRTQPEIVHNLTVDTLHTYYVIAGKTPVLVHNCGPVPNNRPPGDISLELMEADLAGVSPVAAGTSGFSRAASGSGDFLWTVGEGGNLNMVAAGRGIYHTVASGGAPVMGAGQISFRNGAVTSFDNMTGHYTPCPSCAGTFIQRGVDAFGEAGIRIPLRVIRDYGGRAP
ncbi:Hint domain-containing protein [Micromonospora sp.]|uniref:Hint domain-containing protein n=1 Tax=Micromonospora sp. TaxID=1876 RepID=UPI003B3BB1DD